MTLNLTGYRNRHITGVSPTHERSGASVVWTCRCDCGHEFTLPARELKHAKSLGHVGCKLTKKQSHPLYSTWRGMLARCHPVTGDKNYGLRGITVCDEWKDTFTAFLRDMGEKPSKKHSIERVDVNGNYTKENCVWATPAEQMLNLQDKKLSLLDCLEIYNLRTRASIKELANKYKVSEKTIYNIQTNNYSHQTTNYCKTFGLSDFEVLRLKLQRYAIPASHKTPCPTTLPTKENTLCHPPSPTTLPIQPNS